MPRIVVYGNAGSGKTTMARSLGLPHLDLDTIAWRKGTERKDLATSVAELRAFTDAHESWVVEGSYGDLVEAALPFCTELRFLNPGIEACVENCRRRPHEPHKFATPLEQEKALAFLVEWVRQYEARIDEFGLSRHRAIFEGFRGRKREYR
jgi:adenylate kinase family enzyme